MQIQIGKKTEKQKQLMLLHGIVVTGKIIVFQLFKCNK